jgi:HEAT repeats
MREPVDNPTRRGWHPIEVVVSGGDGRAGEVSELLRQLWLGLAAYRLFPGSSTRPGFAAAVERIHESVSSALAAGPIDVEVRSDGFVLAGTALPPNESTERLARACFERRVERVAIGAVPDVRDLERTFAMLSMPPEDLREHGGAEEVLASAGVGSIVLSALGPSAVEGADHEAEGVVASPARMPDALLLASQLRIDDLAGGPGTHAEALFERLRGLVSDLSIEAGREIDLHATVHDVVTELPAELRRSLVELLVDRVRDDPLAERLIGTMSNAELTRALVDLGRDGRRDPVELATHLASAGVRHLDLVDLTEALEAGREEAGTILAGLEAVGVDLTEPRMNGSEGSVTDALAGYLTATERDDVRTMQATLPRTDEQRQASALLAFHDYVTLERDEERLGEVLSLWAEGVQAAMAMRDPVRVRELLEPVREALGGVEDERHSLYGAYVRQALAPEAVLAFMETARAEQSGGATVPEVLEPFGDLGVEVLLDLLAEADRERRAHLLAVLRQVARGHLRPVVARLEDPRWYVVRNAANLLGNAGGEEVLDQLVWAAHHPSAQVRKEAVKALVVAGGVKAVPHLRTLAAEGLQDVRPTAVSVLGAIFAPEAAAALGDIARSSTDRGLRRQALDELAEWAEGRKVLRVLADGDTRPRLPWKLRRHARRLLRDARGAGG